jgi:anti-sigma-K factor RskA
MDERIEDLLALYALGALTEEERAQVDAYVADQPEAQAQLAHLIRAASALPFAATPVEPPASLKHALMDRVHADARARSSAAVPPPPSPVSRFVASLRGGLALPALAGASVLIAIAAGVWALALNAEVGRLRDETAALRRDLARQAEVIAQVSSPGVRVMAIAGTEHQPAARGQLFANPAARSAVLIVADLSPLPEGQVYQFWLIRGETPVSAGTFEVDERGRAVLSVTSDQVVSSFDAMGVSIEPDGGSPQPTGDIVMLSQLS